MPKMKRLKHRGLIVPHPVHKELFIRISWILLSLLVISGGLFYLLAQQRLDEEYFKAHSQIKSTMEMLLPWMITVFTIGILASSLLTLMISRHLSGPLVNFKKSLANVRAGDMTTKIHLRDGDQYHELADDINKIVAGVADDYLLFEKSLKKIDQCISASSTLSEDSNLRLQLEQINQATDAMRRRLLDRKF